MGLLSLLLTRRFGPLFVAQFLGALEDNLFKSAVAIVVTFRAAPAGVSSGAIVALAGGMIILPYLLFSATAGQLADKIDRRRLIQRIKLAEIPVMAVAALALVSADASLMLCSLFLLGVQATFFGPLKYAVLPQLLAPEELVGGNALVEGATFIAILIGTIIGSLMGVTEAGAIALGLAATALAAVGWLATLALPAAPAPSPQLRIGRNLARDTLAVVRSAAHQRPVHLSILGISWFWAIGATYLSLFPVYVKDTLSADAPVVTLFLALFTVGIAVGSLACARLVRHRSAFGHLPLAALGMAAFSVDLWLAGGAAPRAPVGVVDFLADAHGWRIAVDLLAFAFAGGLFIVPLYTLMQTASDERERARTVAANNIVNALFIVASAGVTAVLLSAGLDAPTMFLILAATALGVTLESRLTARDLDGVLAPRLR